MTAHNLGVLLLDAGKRTEAEALCRRALGIFAATLDDGHPLLVACSESLRVLVEEE
jgi:hypothetical protein